VVEGGQIPLQGILDLVSQTSNSKDYEGVKS
jgi:hypothetical protein